MNPKQKRILQILKDYPMFWVEYFPKQDQYYLMKGIDNCKKMTPEDFNSIHPHITKLDDNRWVFYK